MLRTIDVGLGWTLYKRGIPVKPGKYIEFVGRPDELTKRRLGLMAATDPSGRFVRLAEHADWVRWVVQGMFVQEMTAYGGSDGDWVKQLVGGSFGMLRPYQQRFLLDAGAVIGKGWQYRRAAIIGLGGGKTAIGLGLAALGEVAVVLAPRHVHSTWENEARKWGLPCPIITTYESAWKLAEDPKFIPDVLICDEVLRVKNPDAQRTAATKKLSQKASVCVALTGTPTAGGGPMDWRWLDCVRPGCVPQEETPWRFLFSDRTEHKEVASGKKAYVTPADGWNAELIAKWVSPFVYRVDTSELLRHLPPIQYQTITVPKPRDWEVVLKGAATERGVMKRVSQMRMLSDGFIYNDDGQAVRVNEDKANAALEFVEGLGEPVVIVARWRETLSHLARKFAEYNPAVVTSEGGDVAWQLARFRSGETNVLIISARYGEGIDGLQDRARVLLFVSNGSANDRKQMTGRLFRHGQSSGVVVVDVVSEGSMDSRQLELISSQTDLAESQVDKILGCEFGIS